MPAVKTSMTLIRNAEVEVVTARLQRDALKEAGVAKTAGISAYGVAKVTMISSLATG
jgi:hypothetical protein